jgi:hypothetical protein
MWSFSPDFSAANIHKVTFDFFTVESPFPVNKTIIVPSSMTIFAGKITIPPQITIIWLVFGT